MTVHLGRVAPSRGQIERWTTAASRWLLISVIVLSPLALGSIPPEALLVVAGLATLSAASCLSVRSLGWASLPAPAWLILGLTSYTVAQAVRLPTGLVSAIAPTNRDVWESAFQVLGERLPARLPFSLDPGATWLEAIKGWLYACVFVSAAAVGSRRGAGFGATVILSSTLIFALVCLGHGLSEATRVFGLYAPTTKGSGFGVAPLLNPNNRAGYLNLGLLCGVGLLAMRRPPVSRWLAMLAIPPILGISVLTGSRGGLLGLLAGAGVLFVLLRPKLTSLRGDSIQPRQLLLRGGAGIAVGTAFALAAAGSKLHHLLFEQNSSKLSVMVVSLQLLPAHFWSGIGRGSFESVFPALRTATDNTISSHPENFVAQWLIEWGVPVAVLALVLGAVLLRPRNWGVKSSVPACGLLAGVAGLAVQNLFDLGSEVPGIVVAGTAAAGFAWGARFGKLSRPGGRPLSLALVVLSLGALLLWSGVVHGRNTLAADRAWLKERRANREDWQSFRRDVRETILRHPAEPYFPRLAAVAAWKTGTENPIPWINQALARGLSSGRTHYLLGGYLASRGQQAQAMLELRLAATYDPSLSGSVAKVAVKLSHKQEDLQRSVPDGAPGARVLAALAKNLWVTDPELATSLLRQAVAREPTTPATRVALARRLLEDVEARGPGCSDASACLKEASELLAGSESSTDVVRLRAQVLMASDKPADAVRLLADECRRMTRAAPCIASWVEAAKRARDRKAMHQAVQALENEDCSVQNRCDAIFWTAGQAALALGDSDFALRCLERSASGQRSAARWRDVARLARENGQPGRAVGALARARALNPTDPDLGGDLDSVRHDTVEQLLKK